MFFQIILLCEAFIFISTNSGPGGHSSVPRHVTAGTSTTEDAGGRREGAGSAEHEKLLGEHLQHHHHHHHHHQISVQVDQTGL